MVKPNWDTEELIENWTLLPQELELTKKKVGGNQIGFALLLKYFQLFASFPEDKSFISQVVISYIANQVNLPKSSYSDYDWQGRSAKVYRVEIRRLFNFRVASVQDSEKMVTWLIEEILPDEQKNEAIKELVYQRFRELQLEPLTKPQVERLIKRAVANYETNFAEQTLNKLTPEMTDSLIEILTTIIKRIDNRAEKRINQELIEEFKKVSGKTGLLYRIAEVSIAEPSGTIERVIFPVVSLKTFKDLVSEYKATGLAYKRRVHNVMRASFANHYRRMIPQLLEVLEFRSNNDLHRPVIEALELLKKYAHSKARYYDSTEEIPIDGVLKAGAKEILMETDSEGNERINRAQSESFASRRRRRSARTRCTMKSTSLKPSEKDSLVRKFGCAQSESFASRRRRRSARTRCGANRYRNPDNDLPTDFETKRQIYYQALPDPINLRQLKGEINRLWHKTSLLDILKETDLRVDFTRKFKSMGTREILDRDTLQKRLLLCLFGMGTNTGLKRINTGIDGENYQDLIYVRRRYIHKDQLRSAIAEIVNATFEIRLPHIWGEGTTTCASDSKHFGGAS